MDDGDQTVSRTIEQRLGDVRGVVDQAGADVARQLAEHGQILSQRVDAIDMKMVDRAMAMEERINEHNGVEDRQPRGNDRPRRFRLRRRHGRAVEATRRSRGASCSKPATAWIAWQQTSPRSTKKRSTPSRSNCRAPSAKRCSCASRSIASWLHRKRSSTPPLCACRRSRHNWPTPWTSSEAVQLERLEEIERALIELNPNQFVRKVEASSRQWIHSAERQPHAAGEQHQQHHRNPASRRTDVNW